MCLKQMLTIQQPNDLINMDKKESAQVYKSHPAQVLQMKIAL